ncbi:MAG: GntR family transcriptional regulator [Acutalibacteraceae bacterium]|jgi:GntR family transcriptional regulator
MAWDFSNDKPIFQQLIDIITMRIISGRYKPGDRLDSVRDLAVEAGVNPNTMQRALNEIESIGLIYVKRGDGRYITEEQEILNKVRAEYINKYVDEFVAKMSALGLSNDDILKALNLRLIEN